MMIFGSLRWAGRMVQIVDWTVWGDLVYCHKLRVSIPARLHVKKNLLPQISRQSPLGPKSKKLFAASSIPSNMHSFIIN
jgi:hypothetical protein